MPKRSLDVSQGGAPAERAVKKTERSHEENQERAYIAASRRADRSIEARVQSARMASEIHKKRTGKGFKVSEEIVMKEEMYEEDDDELPRQFRALAAHLQTSSPELNSRVNAYLTNQVALATMARAKEVDRMFAQHFPGAASMGQQLQQSVYFQALQTDTMGAPAAAKPYPASSHNSPTPVPYSNNTTIRPSPLSGRHNSGNTSSYAHSPGSHSSHSSPPILSPASGNIDSSTSTPQFAFAQHHGSIAPSLFRGHADQASHHQSAFTSELSQDAKLLGGFNPNDTMTNQFYGISDSLMGGNAFGNGFDIMQQYGDEADDISFVKQEQHQQEPQDELHQTMHSSTTDYFQPSQPTSKLLNIPGQDSCIGTPGGGEGDPWDLWVNDDTGFSFDLNKVEHEQRA